MEHQWVQAVTDASGIASFLYTIVKNSDTYTILAEFLQDVSYAGTSQTNNLHVLYTPTALVCKPCKWI